MKKNTMKIFALTIFLLGLLLVAYPFISMSIDDYGQANKNEKFNNLISKDKSISNKLSKLEKLNKKNIKDEDFQLENVFTSKDVDNKQSKYSKLGINTNDKVGYVSIPKLGQSFDLYLDANYEKIARGVAVLKESDPPIGGAGKRTVIAGHDGYYNRIFFMHIKKLDRGDKIIIKFLNKTLVYSVYEKEIINPTDFDKIKAIENKDVLTLLTCTQRPYYNKRLIVSAIRDVKNENSPKTTDNGLFTYLGNDKVPMNIKLRKMGPYLISLVFFILIIKILIKMYKLIEDREK
ncbi:class C sortase [Peptostreptococcus equinus]|uniref:Class C sortase n=1 Tax=Peptostreptococcus equinus TaxID=3003601 RepID=A0ABY7JPV1_9FIRM|nr:class C sortase [Peptostreptococcus sp. CBA3647]WAW15184.1 class C sortase [Peptostreptococcus sp. CBA3647]